MIFANHNTLLAFGAAADFRTEKKDTEEGKKLQGLESSNFLIYNFISEAVIFFPLRPLAFAQQNKTKACGEIR